MLRVLRQLLVNRPDGKRRHRQSEECHLEVETDRTPGELKHLHLPHCVRLTPLLHDQPVALLRLNADTAAALTFPGSSCATSHLRCLWLRPSSITTADLAVSWSVASTNPRNRTPFPLRERPQARGLDVLVLMVGSRTRGRNYLRIYYA